MASCFDWRPRVTTVNDGGGEVVTVYWVVVVREKERYLDYVQITEGKQLTNQQGESRLGCKSSTPSILPWQSQWIVSAQPFSKPIRRVHS